MSKYRMDIEQHADMFKALGNPHRLALFHRLTTCCSPGTVCDAESASHFSVGQLGEGLDIAPSTLSHHLKELNRAGLIEMRRNGKNVECWIEPGVLNTLNNLFSGTVTVNFEDR
ncbi:MAG: metalloregulator ArsR/SmtB family transcription factor [Candidatus Sedimenticola sp. 4PFRAG1]